MCDEICNLSDVSDFFDLQTRVGSMACDDERVRIMRAYQIIAINTGPFIFIFRLR